MLATIISVADSFVKETIDILSGISSDDSLLANSLIRGNSQTCFVSLLRGLGVRACQAQRTLLHPCAF